MSAPQTSHLCSHVSSPHGGTRARIPPIQPSKFKVAVDPGATSGGRRVRQGDVVIFWNFRGQDDSTVAVITGTHCIALNVLDMRRMNIPLVQGPRTSEALSLHHPAAASVGECAELIGREEVGQGLERYQHTASVTNELSFRPGKKVTLSFPASASATWPPVMLAYVVPSALWE